MRKTKLPLVEPPILAQEIYSASDEWMHTLRNAISAVGVSTALVQHLLQQGELQRAAYYNDRAVKSCEECLSLLEGRRSVAV